MKKCPYCAESIQDEAIVCRYCGRDLEAELPPEDRKKCPHCAEWIRAQAVVCRYCGREFPTSSISEPLSANGEILSASTTDEIQPIMEKDQLGEEKVEEKPTPILIRAILIGFLFAALASVPRLVGFAEISDSPVAFRMWLQDFAFHFISNWVIWSVVAAVFVVLWQRARNIFWGLLGLALILLGWLFLSPDIDIGSVQLSNVLEVVQEPQLTPTQFTKSTPTYNCKYPLGSSINFFNQPLGKNICASGPIKDYHLYEWGCSGQVLSGTLTLNINSFLHGCPNKFIYGTYFDVCGVIQETSYGTRVLEDVIMEECPSTP